MLRNRRAPGFHKLRRRLSASNARSVSSLAVQHPATLIVFDLLHLDGHATRVLPYVRRRVLLDQQLPGAGSSWRVLAALSGGLDAVLAVTRAHDLEGVVAKRLAAAYTPGRRTGAWLKHKHRRREIFAGTGWRPAPKAGRRLDAVFVARADGDGKLTPAGSAEVGLSGDEREQLRAALEQRHVRSRRGGRRVPPGIWLEIDFHGADRGPLRDRVMRALRVDESPGLDEQAVSVAATSTSSR